MSCLRNRSSPTALFCWTFVFILFTVEEHSSFSEERTILGSVHSSHFPGKQTFDKGSSAKIPVTFERQSGYWQELTSLQQQLDTFQSTFRKFFRRAEFIYFKDVLPKIDKRLPEKVNKTTLTTASKGSIKPVEDKLYYFSNVFATLNDQATSIESERSRVDGIVTERIKERERDLRNAVNNEEAAKKALQHARAQQDQNTHDMQFGVVHGGNEWKWLNENFCGYFVQKTTISLALMREHAGNWRTHRDNAARYRNKQQWHTDEVSQKQNGLRGAQDVRFNANSLLDGGRMAAQQFNVLNTKLQTVVSWVRHMANVGLSAAGSKTTSLTKIAVVHAELSKVADGMALFYGVVSETQCLSAEYQSGKIVVNRIQAMSSEWPETEMSVSPEIKSDNPYLTEPSVLKFGCSSGGSCCIT